MKSVYHAPCVTRCQLTGISGPNNRVDTTLHHIGQTFDVGKHLSVTHIIGFCAFLVLALEFSTIFEGRVDPAVIDAQRNHVELVAVDIALVDFVILLEEVVGKFRAIVSTEGLHELPDIRSCLRRGVDIFGTDAKARADGLVNVEHVCVFVPGVRVEAWLSVVVDEVAWPMFSEKADHRGASRTTVEPDSERGVLSIVTGLEEPKPHTVVLAYVHTGILSIAQLQA
ncbi:hypothetical protein HG530_000638 [Fusarium avenaceum]|nr:hypothetical protein HG530_000638 [Fusarium avenaceum]